jgi:hypothetical protein
MVTRIGDLRRTYFLVFLRSVRRLLVTANAVPSSPILVTMMMKALSSSETSVLTRATQRNIPEEGILRSHLRENLKSSETSQLNVQDTLQLGEVDPEFQLLVLSDYTARCISLRSSALLILSNSLFVCFKGFRCLLWLQLRHYLG